MTKEEILHKHLGEIIDGRIFDVIADPESGELYRGEKHGETKILNAMDEYAKEVAIGFIEYHDKFRREEARWWHRESEKAGGVITWMGEKIEVVFDNYINKKPIESYLAPEGIESHWYYNDNGQLVHSSEKKSINE